MRVRVQISSELESNPVFGQESRSPEPVRAPSVDRMCFMFGASKEDVHRLLGLLDEPEHEEEALVVPATEDWSQD